LSLPPPTHSTPAFLPSLPPPPFLRLEHIIKETSSAGGGGDGPHLAGDAANPEGLYFTAHKWVEGVGEEGCAARDVGVPGTVLHGWNGQPGGTHTF
jgi:hypothetical protein